MMNKGAFPPVVLFAVQRTFYACLHYMKLQPTVVLTTAVPITILAPTLGKGLFPVSISSYSHEEGVGLPIPWLF